MKKIPVSEIYESKKKEKVGIDMGRSEEWYPKRAQIKRKGRGVNRKRDISYILILIL